VQNIKKLLIDFDDIFEEQSLCTNKIVRFLENVRPLLLIIAIIQACGLIIIDKVYLIMMRRRSATSTGLVRGRRAISTMLSTRWQSTICHNIFFESSKSPTHG